MITYNGKDLYFNSYPNNERYLDIEFKNGIKHIIIFKYENDISLIELFLLFNELNNQCVGDYKELYISYMPYSRLDRKECGRIFSLKYISQLINSFNCNAVYIVEPHSDVTCALINRSYRVKIIDKLLDYSLRAKWIEFGDNDLLFFPDAGAQKNFSYLSKKNIGVGIKHRDFESGNIISYSISIPNGYEVEGKNIVIVDDLCSKGGTFYAAAKELIKYNPKNIYLIVAHLENTVTTGSLLYGEYIKRVISTDSIFNDRFILDNDVLKIVSYTNCLPCALPFPLNY